MIFGAGAIGGVVGARLHQSGHQVLLIARGAHHDAIARDGLTLLTPVQRVTLRIPVAATAQEAGLTGDDVVLLSTKSQDTEGALESLRQARPGGVPVVCLQNGVENERVALRTCSDVYGAVVMSPTAHLEPGVVLAYAAKQTGTIDVGRYPSGIDGRCEAVCASLAASQFGSEAREDIMRHKYAKLILNLGNAVQAICGDDADGEELVERAREEARGVLRTSGIPFEVDEVADMRGRWKRWGVGEIDGHPRGGGSTWQSVTRGAGSVETDYLNGEIVLQGRLSGVATPVNALLQELTRTTLRSGQKPGWLAPDEILRQLPAR